MMYGSVCMMYVLMYVLTEDHDLPWVQSCKYVMYVAAGRGVSSKFPGLHPLSAGAEAGAPLRGVGGAGLGQRGQL